MNEEEKKRLDQEIEFRNNKHLYPSGLRKSLDEFFDLVKYFRERQEYIDEVSPLLYNLMMLQYPDFKNITAVVQLDWIKEHNKINAMSLYGQANNIIQDQLNGVNVIEKYPRLEEWRAFYCRPHAQRYLTEENLNSYYYQSMAVEEREKSIIEENRKLKLLHEWKEKQRNEYYETVQPLLFSHLPGLQNMESDWWVIYAVSIRDLYEEWNQLCEELETAIEYDLPPESCNWKYDKFLEAVKKRTTAQYKAALEKRDRKIYGSTGPS